MGRHTTRRAVLGMIGTGTFGGLASAQNDRGGPENSVRIHFSDCTSLRVTGAASLEGLDYRAVAYFGEGGQYDTAVHRLYGSIERLPLDYDLWDDLGPRLEDDPHSDRDEVTHERITSFRVSQGDQVIVEGENDAFSSRSDCY